MSSLEQNKSSAARRAAKRALSKPKKICPCKRECMTGVRCSTACLERWPVKHTVFLKGTDLPFDPSERQLMGTRWKRVYIDRGYA